jgi:hypothetical protein
MERADLFIKLEVKIVVILNVPYVQGNPLYKGFDFNNNK